MTLASLVLDALFPDSCLACLAPRDSTFRHDVACDSCLRSTTLPSSYSCSECSAPSHSLTPACHPSSAVFLSVGAAGERVTSHLASALLYEGIHRASAPLGELAAAAAAANGIPLHRAYVTPIPEALHILRERGYDANLLVSRTFATTLSLSLSEHVLTASRIGGRTIYGIGTPGDAASADIVVLVSVEAPPRPVTHQLSQLVRAACPHAHLLFITCTS